VSQRVIFSICYPNNKCHTRRHPLGESIYHAIHPKVTANCLGFHRRHVDQYAGLAPIADFVFDQLGFAERVEVHLDLPLHHNVKYPTVQMLTTILLGYIADRCRLCHLEAFSADPMVQTAVGLPGPIDENTVVYRLKKFTWRTANQWQTVIGSLRQPVQHIRPAAGQAGHPRWQIIDLDSTVCGHQAGGAKGDHPGKNGQPSYHPLLAFLTATKEVLQSWWRPGNTYTGNGAAEFLQTLCPQLPANDRQWLVRADSGFSNGAILKTLEDRGARYLTKVKLRNFQTLLGHCLWETIPGAPTLAYAEQANQALGWDRPRTLVFLRRRVREDRAGLLFPLVYDTYECFVTNVTEAPVELWRLYHDRGECEHWKAPVKQPLHARTTPVDDFWANDVLWSLAVLAYNVLIWIRWLTDPTDSWHEEPQTFRAWFILVLMQVFNTRMQAPSFSRCCWRVAIVVWAHRVQHRLRRGGLAGAHMPRTYRTAGTDSLQTGDRTPDHSGDTAYDL